MCKNDNLDNPKQTQRWDPDDNGEMRFGMINI